MYCIVYFIVFITFCINPTFYTPLTKLSVNSTKLSVNSTKLSVNSTKLSVNSTKLSVNSTKLSVNSTKLSVNSTKLLDEATNLYNNEEYFTLKNLEIKIIMSIMPFKQLVAERS